MKNWPEELPYSDPFFPIIMNDWMDWEDLDVLLTLVTDWVISDQQNFTRHEAILMDLIVGIA